MLIALTPIKTLASNLNVRVTLDTLMIKIHANHAKKPRYLQVAYAKIVH